MRIRTVAASEFQMLIGCESIACWRKKKTSSICELIGIISNAVDWRKWDCHKMQRTHGEEKTFRPEISVL